MSYADRQVERAYKLVDEFVRNKIRQNARPDMVHHQVEAHYSFRTGTRSETERDLDGWMIAAREGRCIVALEDGGILEGQLKISATLFRRDRSSVTSYAYWKEFNKDKLISPYHCFGGDLTVDIAEAIIVSLAPSI